MEFRMGDEVRALSEDRGRMREDGKGAFRGNE